MSISAVNSSSATSQLAAFARLSGTGYTASTGGTPPPKPDDGAFLDAISSALSAIGVTVADGESEASDDATASGTAGTADAGQALGAFLHQLMGSLRAQGGAGDSGEEGEGGEPPAGPPPGGGGSGLGNIESDLQSLLSKLTSSGSDSTASSDSGVSELQSSFSSLLSALGGSSDSGSSDKLASFLQALSGSLGSASAGGSLSSSGNLVNTTA